MAFFTQQDRLLAIDSPLGQDVLLLTRLEGQENISALFSFEVELYSASTHIAADKIVGENVTLKVMQSDALGLRTGSYRHFNGFVRRFRGEGEHLQGLRRYTAEVVPWLWFLTQTSDSKIFQNKDIKQIATDIFTENGFNDFEFRLIGQHPEREYCVQYQESDFTFLSRLFEEEGIFYYFSHEKDKHTLIIADHNGAYETCAESSVSYRAGSLSAHTIHAWSHQYEFRTGRYAKRDYDFTKPSDRLQTGMSADMPLPGVKRFEHFIYPGRYEDKSLGDQLTRLRVEQDEACHDQVKGESGCRSFTPGHSFTLNRHDDAPTEMDDYLILGVHHQASDFTYTSRDDVEREYKNSFRAMPTSRVYRPAMITGWPKMQGPQNAMVVGPAGEEIYTDNYGRVKIQFPWDRYGQYNENSSCWVRMSNNWAGKNWGGIFIPRIGQEVIVDFYDGNPDRPIITGRVYNAEQTVPYKLPANATQSGVKSRSSKDGSPANFNEIRMEDKKGAEQLFIHAEKNQDIEVENDETHWVGHDRSKTIDNDETVHVKHDRTETVDNNETITIGVDRTEDVGNNEKITIGVNRTEHVGSNETITIGANRTEKVGANEKITIVSNRTEDVGGNETIDITGNRNETVKGNEGIEINGNQRTQIGQDESRDVDRNRTTSIGQNDSLDVGKHFALTAGDSITLTTGASSLTMKKDGSITIRGKNIIIDGSGAINIKANKNVVIKGQKILQN